MEAAKPRRGGSPSPEMERSGAAGEGPAAGPSPPPKRNERFLRVEGRVITYFFDGNSSHAWHRRASSRCRCQCVMDGKGMAEVCMCVCDGLREWVLRYT